MTTDCVLVTGAFGLVGSAVVAKLADEGRRVVATDLDVPAHRKRAQELTARSSVQVRWANLTSPAEVSALVEAVAPTAIIHLAAIIPPFCYARRELAYTVNVDATAMLVRAASELSTPPRFVQASSIAVYGARNPYRDDSLLTASTPVRPTDLYGQHKALAEQCVTTSDLDWVVLRLGGVLAAEPRLEIDHDLVFFEAVLPSDGRIHTVDVRDVAHAFSAATVTDYVREIFVIGGDHTHRITQARIGSDYAAAMGLPGAIPTGRPGNPDDDLSWYATDWIDTDPAQNALAFQHHSLPSMLAETRARVGWWRFPLRLVAPSFGGIYGDARLIADSPVPRPIRCALSTSDLATPARRSPQTRHCAAKPYGGAVSREDRRRWDERYARLGPADAAAAELPDFLVPHANLIPTTGHALDIACGQGQRAVWLAGRGLQVWGWDVSDVAVGHARDLARRSGVGDRCRFDTVDLDDGLPAGEPVEFILCNRFRDHRLDRALIERLTPGGLLAIATLSEVGAAPGPFRAAPGELPAAFAELEVLATGEGDGSAWLLARA